MRFVTVELCGETLHLPVNYSAGSKLSAAGHDPFAVSLNKFSALTGEGAIRILHVGASEAGSKLTLEQIGNHVYEKGIAAYVNHAAKYILAFVTATTEHPVSGEAGGGVVAWDDYCRACFKIFVCGWSRSPSDFWPLSPQEFCWMFDMLRADREHIRLRYDKRLLELIGGDGA